MLIHPTSSDLERLDLAGDRASETRRANEVAVALRIDQAADSDARKEETGTHAHTHVDRERGRDGQARSSWCMRVAAAAGR